MDSTIRQEEEKERERKDTTVDQTLHDEHTLVIRDRRDNNFSVPPRPVSRPADLCMLLLYQQATFSRIHRITFPASSEIR
jgi:hypothetical protein